MRTNFTYFLSIEIFVYRVVFSCIRVAVIRDASSWGGWYRKLLLGYGKGVFVYLE